MAFVERTQFSRHLEVGGSSTAKHAFWQNMSDVLIIGVWGVIMALLRADALEVEGSIGVREVNHDFALLAEVSLGIIPGGERGFGDGLLLADHLALEEEFAVYSNTLK